MHVGRSLVRCCDVLYRSQNRRTGGESDTMWPYRISSETKYSGCVRYNGVADGSRIFNLYTRACERQTDDP
jgi:hypothetical protein